MLLRTKQKASWADVSDTDEILAEIPRHARVTQMVKDPSLTLRMTKVMPEV